MNTYEVFVEDFDGIPFSVEAHSELDAAFLFYQRIDTLFQDGPRRLLIRKVVHYESVNYVVDSSGSVTECAPWAGP